MRLLLDTHIFLWYIANDPQLPFAYRTAVQDPANDVYLSVASIWEAVIKYGLNKLPVPAPPEEFFPQQRALHHIESLPIVEDDFLHLAKLPPLHRDPFDRIIMAQSLHNSLIILTVDEVICTYPVSVLAAK